MMQNDDIQWFVDDPSLSRFADVTALIAQTIKQEAQQGATDEQWEDSQAMCVVEEAGEFIGEYRRLKGFARRGGDREKMLAELSDVVIASMIMFWNLDADPHSCIKDKLRKIVTRGYVNKD